MTLRRALAAIALLAGLLAAFAGNPYPREQERVTPLELAAWIKDRKPGLRVIDLRSATEFETYHIPGAQRAAVESLSFGPDETLVFIGDGRRAAFGSRRVYLLHGGMNAWLDDVMSPKASSELTRYFGAVARGSGATPAAKAIRRRGC